VFALRDPVDRAYSHYWHRVRTGREVLGFERALERRPGNMYRWSLYRDCLERYFRAFDREQIHIVIFEEYVHKPERVIERLADFLDLSAPPEEANTHRNRSTLPLAPSVQRTVNWLRQFGPGMWFVDHLPEMPGGAPGIYEEMGASEILLHALAAGADRVLDRLPQVGYPEMDPATRRFLERTFARENRGLGELIGRGLSEYWPCMAR